MREHRYLKEKIISLQNALNKKSTMEDQFKQDIEDLPPPNDFDIVNMSGHKFL